MRNYGVYLLFHLVGSHHPHHPPHHPPPPQYCQYDILPMGMCFYVQCTCIVGINSNFDSCIENSCQ